MEVASFRKKELISNYIILGIFAIVSLAPILVLIFNAFKPAVEFGTNPIGLPNNITFQNFPDAWVQGEYSKIFFNSSVVSSCSLILIRDSPYDSNFVCFKSFIRSLIK